jgi:hypothetical protein
MNEQQFGHLIKQTLNQGFETDATVLAKLKVARETALERQRVSAAFPLLAWAGNTTGTGSGPRAMLPRLLLPTLLLVLGLFAVNYWYQLQQAEETVEIDSAVLLGDLPLDAYLDKGFGAWLKSSSED